MRFQTGAMSRGARYPRWDASVWGYCGRRDRLGQLRQVGLDHVELGLGEPPARHRGDLREAHIIEQHIAAAGHQAGQVAFENRLAAFVRSDAVERRVEGISRRLCLGGARGVRGAGSFATHPSKKAGPNTTKANEPHRTNLDTEPVLPVKPIVCCRQRRSMSFLDLLTVESYQKRFPKHDVRVSYDMYLLETSRQSFRMHGTPRPFSPRLRASCPRNLPKSLRKMPALD